jgi:hypothetical protein
VEGAGAVTAATAAANLGGVALFALPGLGLAELVSPLARLPLWRRLGYAFLLGVAVVAGTLFAASHLLGAPLRRPAIATACLTPIAVGIAAAVIRRRRADRRRRRRAPPDPGRPAWESATGPVAALLIAAVCLGPLAMALSVPLGDWDGRMTWCVDAAYMRQEGTVDARVLRDAHWFMMVPRYPPLLPVAQVAIQETFGAAQDEQLFRAFYVAFLAALLLVIHHGAARAAGRAAAALATLAVALPPVVSYGLGGATSAYSDLPLAAFYGAARVVLLTARPGLASGLAAGCLLAGSVLAKNEGQLLAAVALLLGSARLLRWRRRPLGLLPDRPGPPDRLPPVSRTPPFPRTRNLQPLAWLAAAALPALAAAVLLASWRAGIPDRFSPDYVHGLGVAALLHGLASRLPRIVGGLLGQSWRWSDWRGLWIVVPAALIAGHRALRRPLARRLLLAGLAPAAIGLAAYSMADVDLAELIPETWSRFLMQALAPLAIVFACALSELLLRPGAVPPPAGLKPGG